MKEYTYTTMFWSSAEKAYEWLLDHVNRVAVTAPSHELVAVTFRCDVATREAFDEYMGFIYAR